MKRFYLFIILTIAILLLAACSESEPETVEVEVTRVVKETVVETVKETVVETVKETVIVEGTPEVVEAEVTRVVEVEVEKVVTPTPPPASPAEPKILHVGATLDGYRYDPEIPTDVTVGGNVGIFDTLTRFDEDFGLQPWLATSWEYDQDRGVWTFQLRDDVYFHDGVQLTAPIIADYFNYFSIDSYMAELLQIGEGATIAVDDFTLEIKTENVQLPANASHSTMGIRRGDPFAGEHIGTGPFVFQEYVPNEHITVAANPDYWNGVPKIDGVELRFMPDPMTRMLALQAGEVDVIYDPPREAMAALEGREDLGLHHTVPASFMEMDLMVTGEEPWTILQEPSVREALGFGINRQEIIDSAWGGFATMGQTFVAPGLLGDYADMVEGYTHDPERAKTLLEEAGWVDEDGDGIREKDGKRLTLRLVNGWPSAIENGPVPEVMQPQLAEVGIELDIIPVADFPGLGTYLIPREADIFLETWTNTAPTPCMMPTFGFYGPEEPNMWQAIMSPAFAGFPEINEFVENCAAATTQEEAQKWAAEAIHIAVDEARTSIPVFGVYRSWGTGPRVVEFVPHPIHSYVRWEWTELED